MWLFVFFFFISSIAHAFSPSPIEIQNFFDYSIREESMKEAQISTLAFMITNSTDEIFFGSYGCEKCLNNKRTNVTRETVFPIGSVSKLFVAISYFLNFGEDAKNNLDKDCNSFVPKDLQYSKNIVGNFESQNGLPVYSTDEIITIRNLFTHTAGLDERMIFNIPNDTNYYDIQHNFPSRIRKPNEVSSYSNYGISMIASVIESTNNFSLSYGDFLKKNILIPLNLTSSYYPYTEALKLSSNIVEATKRNGDSIETADWTLMLTDGAVKPAADLYMSMKDFGKFMRFNLKKGIDLGITEDQFNLMTNVSHYSISNSSQIKAIHLAYYDQKIAGLTFNGHAGTTTPINVIYLTNFENDVGIYIAANGDSNTIYDIIERFVTKFVQNETFCSNNGGFLEDEKCNRRIEYSDLLSSSEYKRNESYSFYQKKYSQIIDKCFFYTRREHTSFRKFGYFLEYLGRQICFSLNSDGYLIASDVSLGYNYKAKEMIFLDKFDSSLSSPNTMDFIAADHVKNSTHNFVQYRYGSSVSDVTIFFGEKIYLTSQLIFRSFEIVPFYSYLISGFAGLISSILCPIFLAFVGAIIIFSFLIVKICIIKKRKKIQPSQDYFNESCKKDHFGLEFSNWLILFLSILFMFLCMVCFIAFWIEMIIRMTALRDIDLNFYIPLGFSMTFFFLSFILFFLGQIPSILFCLFNFIQKNSKNTVLMFLDNFICFAYLLSSLACMIGLWEWLREENLFYFYYSPK